MDSNTLLAVLKTDLQTKTTANDSYLTQLLNFSLSQLKEMGITVTMAEDTEGNAVASDESIQMIQVHFASYLFRKRAGEETGMPRFLKREINNLLFSQKMGEES